MGSTIRTVGFSGEGTLWHPAPVEELTVEALRVVGRHLDRSQAEIRSRLLEIEQRNLQIFGHGVKGSTLSVIEAAIELTDGRLSADDIRVLLDLCKAMLDHPVHLIEGARQTVEALRVAGYDVVVIAKGDMHHELSKLGRSGLSDVVTRVDVVSEKVAAAYTRVLRRHSISPAAFLMIGDSLDEDVLPVTTIGACAVHVPYVRDHVLDRPAEVPVPTGKHWTLDSVRGVPQWLRERMDSRG